MDYVEELVYLPDGRTLEVASLGEPAGATIFFHHGTPASSRSVKMFAPLLELGNFFFVTTSRAGYGRSSRHEGRSIASVVDDARAALDHFGRGDYVAAGWSGGGPHALACAAFDTPRCLGAVSLASVAPMDADFDWTAGMGQENIEEFELAKQGGPAFEAAIAAAGAFFKEMTSDNVIDMIGGLLSDPDKETLASVEARGLFAEVSRYAFNEGYWGFYDDDLAFCRSWGFYPHSIEVPVDVFYGDADLMVPPTHGAWLMSHLPSATPHHHGADGHLSICANHFDEVALAFKSALH